MSNFDLVSSLQALPETDPIEVDGIQFGGSGTCGSVNQCIILSVQIILVQSVCAILASC